MISDKVARIGLQVIYIPDHAKNNIHHPDCELGFITRLSFSQKKKTACCRYWIDKDKPLEKMQIRTVSCSEATNYFNLLELKYNHPFTLFPQRIINKLVDRANDINNFGDLLPSFIKRTIWQEINLQQTIVIGDEVIVNTGGKDSTGVIDNGAGNKIGYYHKRLNAYLVKFANNTRQFIGKECIRKKI